MIKKSLVITLSTLLLIAFATSTWAEWTGYGCTPGYWKQDQHFGSWTATDYSPDDMVSEVFKTPLDGEMMSCVPESNMTLLEALSAQKKDFDGDDNKAALLRHAVAALLNMNHPEVAGDLFGMESMKVMNGFCCAYEGTCDWEMKKDMFAAINESGCPLGRDTGDDPPPPGEICDDGMDNDGNSLADCKDPACMDTDTCLPD